MKNTWTRGAMVLMALMLLSVITFAHAAPRGTLTERAVPAGSHIVADHFINAADMEKDDISHPLSPAVLASLHLSPAVVQPLTAYRGYDEFVTAQPKTATTLSEYTYLYPNEETAKAAEEAVGTLFAHWSATSLPDAASVGHTFRQEGKEGAVYWLVLRKGNRLSLLLFDGLEEKAIRQLYDATLLKLQN